MIEYKCSLWGHRGWNTWGNRKENTAHSHALRQHKLNNVCIMRQKMSISHTHKPAHVFRHQTHRVWTVFELTMQALDFTCDRNYPCNLKSMSAQKTEYVLQFSATDLSILHLKHCYWFSLKWKRAFFYVKMETCHYCQNENKLSPCYSLWVGICNIEKLISQW